MRVSVFGSSAPQPGAPAYIEAQKLGSLLGENGHTVLTGGYIGTMEAVSRGANEAGGHVIGVTCTEIERWRPIGANPWVQEEWKRTTLMERLDALIQHCDAALALPGGPGTLAEISVLWNRLIINALSPRPLVLIGPGWQQTLQAFFNGQEPYVALRDRHLVTFAPDVDQAFAIIQKFKRE